TPSVLDDAVKGGRSVRRSASPTRGPAHWSRPTSNVARVPCVGAQKYLERLSDVTPPTAPRSNQNGGMLRVVRATPARPAHRPGARKTGPGARPCTTDSGVIRAIHNLWTTVWTVLHHGRLQATSSARSTPRTTRRKASGQPGREHRRRLGTDPDGARGPARHEPTAARLHPPGQADGRPGRHGLHRRPARADPDLSRDRRPGRPGVRDVVRARARCPLR